MDTVPPDHLRREVGSHAVQAGQAGQAGKAAWETCELTAASETRRLRTAAEAVWQTVQLRACSHFQAL